VDNMATDYRTQDAAYRSMLHDIHLQRDDDIERLNASSSYRTSAAALSPTLRALRRLSAGILLLASEALASLTSPPAEATACTLR